MSDFKDKIPVSRIINQLAKKPFSVLAGAGVSCSSPSNLPTVEPILEHFLKVLAPNASAYRTLRKASLPPFELSMEFLSRNFDPEISFLKFLYSCRTPNKIHNFLANCVIKNIPCLSPNFDWLIEKAIRDLDCMPKVVATRTQFQRAINSKPRFPVWKIHGSFQDERGREIRSSIKATLSAVTQSGLGFEWEPARQTILRRLLSGRILLVIGYSGLDDIDILPAIRSIPDIRGIVWVNHTPRPSITSRKFSGKSNEGQNKERHLEFLNEIASRKPSFGVFEIRGKTEKFVMLLHDALGYPSQKKNYPDYDPEWKDQISRWANRHFKTSTDRWNWAAHVYAAQNRKKQELGARKRALIQERRRRNRPRLYYNIGKCFASMKQNKDAVTFFQKTLNKLGKRTDIGLRLSALASLASVESKLGDLAMASLHANRALALRGSFSKKHPELVRAYYALSIVEEAKGHLHQARKLLEKSVLPAFKKLGDLQGYIWASEDLSATMRKLHLHKEAIDTAKHALVYAQASHNPRYTAYAHIYCADAYGVVNRTSLALHHAKECMDLAENNGFKELAIRACRYSAWIFHKSKRFSEALPLYQQILSYDLHHRTSEYPETLTNLADVYMRLGRVAKALGMFRRAALSMAARGRRDDLKIVHMFIGRRCLEQAHQYLRSKRTHQARQLALLARKYLIASDQKEDLAKCECLLTGMGESRHKTK